jgi:cysteine-rich repeat protein
MYNTLDSIPKNICNIVPSDASLPNYFMFHSQDTCGNSFLDSSETCDDGDQTSSDGCSHLCQIETGYSCNNSIMPATCSAAVCGNSLVETGETCDDGDLTGCQAGCLVAKAGWTCTSTQGSISVCSALLMGDGIKAGTERCDDENTVSEDGCSSIGEIEEGWSCSEDSAFKSICTTICGDGLRVGEEVCDDKNTVSEDGCNNSCSELEAGFVCKSKKDGGRHTEDYDTNCLADDPAIEAIGQTSAGIGAASTVLLGLKAVTSFKMGADVFMMMNTIQVARTTTLIAPNMNRHIKKSFNEDFVMFNLEIPYAAEITTKSLDLVSIYSYDLGDPDVTLSEYGMENFSFVFVAVTKLLPSAAVISGLGALMVVGKVASLLFGRFPFVKSIYGTISRSVFFNVPIRYLQETVLDLTLSGFLSIKASYQALTSRRRLASSISNVSGILAMIFVVILFFYTVGLTIYMLRKKKMSKMSKRVLQVAEGLNQNKKSAVIIYFSWFFFLRFMICLNIAFSGLLPSMYQALLFLMLITISFVLMVRQKIFDSWWKQIGNFLLELSFVFLALITFFLEFYTFTEE